MKLMTLLIASDIHGSARCCAALMERIAETKPDRVLLLGDLLYHGPRNGVPNLYDPVKVAQILNGLKDKIVAVRGNCDAEVDQMMFEFPMMSDYAILEADGETFFLTHGHLWNECKLPPVGIGTVLAHGHTHIPEFKTLACGMKIFNPGSVSLPKGGTSRSIGYFDGKELRHFTI